MHPNQLDKIKQTKNEIRIIPKLVDKWIFISDSLSSRPLLNACTAVTSVVNHIVAQGPPLYLKLCDSNRSRFHNYDSGHPN